MLNSQQTFSRRNISFNEVTVISASTRAASSSSPNGIAPIQRIGVLILFLRISCASSMVATPR